MRSQLVVAMLVFGCGSKEAKETPGAHDEPGKPSLVDRPSKRDRKPTGTPRPQAKLKVTLDGKPVDMQQALAWRDRSGGIRVTASSVPVGCEEVTGSMRRIHDGEVSFDLTLGNTLQPDGTVTTEIKSTYFSGMTSQMPEGPTVTTGDAAPSSTFTAEVDFKTSSAGSDKHELVVKGTIDALGCEPGKPTGEAAPALPPEMPATIEIAGKKLPIRGAQLSTSGSWRTLKLTTGAETCKSWSGGELTVEIGWKSKDDVDPHQVSIGGTLVKQAADQTFDKKKLTVKPSPVVAGEVEVSGDLMVMKYPVKLAGKVTAVECK